MNTSSESWGEEKSRIGDKGQEESASIDMRILYFGAGIGTVGKSESNASQEISLCGFDLNSMTAHIRICRTLTEN